MKVVRDWGLRFAYAAELIDWSKIRGLVIHHTATGPSNSYAASTRSIQEGHISKGLSTIAYSFLGAPTGALFVGHGFATLSQAHRDANPTHLALCFYGNEPEMTPAYEEMFHWVRSKLLDRQPKATEVHPHERFSPGNTCPGASLKRYIEDKEWEMAFTDKQETFLKNLVMRAKEEDVDPRDIARLPRRLSNHKHPEASDDHTHTATTTIT